MNRLEHKVAIITGAAQGIGYSTARMFIQEGAKVIIWDINEEAGHRARAAIEQETGTSQANIEFTAVNVAEFSSVIAATEKAISKWGQIDILINNAGITRDATLKKMTVEQWQGVLDVNLSGVFHCTKAVMPFMIEKQGGRILNTTSVVALYGNFGQSNYVASKAGIIGLTKVWARELGRHGITVNAVAPGFVATEMVKTVPEKVIAGLIERTPAGRLGEPDDISRAYLFLASDEASFINGAILSVDGGLTL
ncbi:beta-ketoacyl-ACP reductase [candidate division CSSED10-310 bacterium]|uniref:Beta-ketoacyl-ACP reductase n=1 Tax=candidate division CSSED10-310 bacterium TaxID=2855610 RepID=A0ABV6Z1I7_UNCC1